MRAFWRLVVFGECWRAMARAWMAMAMVFFWAWLAWVGWFGWMCFGSGFCRVVISSAVACW